jgi:hypothetical protein
VAAVFFLACAQGEGECTGPDLGYAWPLLREGGLARVAKLWDASVVQLTELGENTALKDTVTPPDQGAPRGCSRPADRTWRGDR